MAKLRGPHSTAQKQVTGGDTQTDDALIKRHSTGITHKRMSLDIMNDHLLCTALHQLNHRVL